jgi:hypothetical protein
MAGKLEGLVVPVMEPLGYRHGWAGEVNRRIAEAAQGAPIGLELGWTDVNKVLTCPGWWEATRTTDPVPPNIIDLHRSLIVDIATAYLEENAVWGAPSPIDFVREYLSNEVNFDPLTATWLFLLDELARTELTNGLAARISLMVSSWPQVMDATQVSLGPVVENLSVGGVRLRGQHVDAVYGDSRLGVEVSWPGAVLVRFVAERATPEHLEQMDMAALVHTLATGCPPQRVVVYSLSTGDGIGMDVEREWMEMTIGGVISAVKEISKIDSHGVGELSPGSQCTLCPWRDECSVSEADEYPF